ncbi:MAG TPA: hypothetical protein VFZ67_04290 [Nitrososphaera sp.]
MKAKEREKQHETTHIEDTERLVTEEIEMLKVVLYLVARDRRNVKVSFSRWVLVKTSSLFRDQNDKERLQLEEM